MPRQYTPRVPLICETCSTTYIVQAGAAQYRRFCSDQCSRRRSRGSDAERFWAKVRKDGPILRPDLGPCWVWTGARNPDGYGRFRFQNRNRPAHAVAYILTAGQEVPADRPQITHLCDGGPIGCVRPSHLMPDTHAGNFRQAAERKRIPYGVRHWRSVLSEDMATAIRARYSAGGITHAELAIEYAVSRMTVSDVIARRTWRHI